MASYKKIAIYLGILWVFPLFSYASYGDIANIGQFPDYSTTGWSMGTGIDPEITASVQSIAVFMSVSTENHLDLPVQFEVRNNSAPNTSVDCRTATSTPRSLGITYEGDHPEYPTYYEWGAITLLPTGSACLMEIGTTYVLKNVDPYTGEATTTPSVSVYGSDVGDVYYAFSSSLELNPMSGNDTRIYYFDPEYNEIVATSTTFTLEVNTYVNPNEYETDMYVRLSYVRQEDLQSAVANTDLLWTHLDFASLDLGGDSDQVLTDGYSFLSTTTSITSTGTYLLKAEIRSDVWFDTLLSWWNLNNFFDGDIVVASSSRFIVDELTAWEQFLASSTASVSEFFSSTTLTYDQMKNVCWSISGFDFIECLNFLFGWQQAPMSELMDDMREGIFTYVPFGYITRTYEILATTSTTTLATISHTFDEDFPVPVLAGEEIAFDPWDYFFVEGSPVSDVLTTSEGKNVWDIFEPLIKIIVYMTLGFMIIKELLQIRYSHRENL